MSIMDRMKFWKKEEDPGFGPDPFAGQPTDNITQANDPLAQPADPFATDPLANQQQPEQFPQTSQPEPFQAQRPEQAMGQPFGQREFQPFPQQTEPARERSEGNTELILTRLDTIKAMLEGINQRLTNLERRNEYKW